MSAVERAVERAVTWWRDLKDGIEDRVHAAAVAAIAILVAVALGMLVAGFAMLWLDVPLAGGVLTALIAVGYLLYRALRPPGGTS